MIFLSILPLSEGVSASLNTPRNRPSHLVRFKLLSASSYHPSSALEAYGLQGYQHRLTDVLEENGGPIKEPLNVSQGLKETYSSRFYMYKGMYAHLNLGTS
jgi:hypothetical protein